MEPGDSLPVSEQPKSFCFLRGRAKRFLLFIACAEVIWTNSVVIFFSTNKSIFLLAVGLRLPQRSLDTFSSGGRQELEARRLPEQLLRVFCVSCSTHPA